MQKVALRATLDDLPTREGNWGGGVWPFALEGDWDLSKPLDEWTVRFIVPGRCRRRIVAARVLTTPTPTLHALSHPRAL